MSELLDFDGGDTTKVLNLYAGIGGNRKLWDEVSNVDVTAVEWDNDKAAIYRDHFPDDTVIETDAHEYLLNHFDEFDFIWTSPPCPTHSQIRYDTREHNQTDAIYPDMKLYQEILLLQNYYDGDYAVENVDPYYEPLLTAQKVQKHLFWSNYHIPDIELSRTHMVKATIDELQEMLGFDLSKYDLSHDKRRKMLRNCVRPKLGKHVFRSRDKQTTLSLEKSNAK